MYWPLVNLPMVLLPSHNKKLPVGSGVLLQPLQQPTDTQEGPSARWGLFLVCSVTFNYFIGEAFSKLANPRHAATLWAFKRTLLGACISVSPRCHGLCQYHRIITTKTGRAPISDLL